MLSKLFLLFLLCTLMTAAQQPMDNVSYRYAIKPDSVLRRIQRNKIDFLEKIKKQEPGIASELRKRYDERWRSFSGLLKEGYFFPPDTLNGYVQSLVNKIAAASSFIIRKEYTVLVGRTIVPNACAMGEGVIIVNAGLVSKLEYEGELVFILAHEMAHDYLDHNYLGDLHSIKMYRENNIRQNMRRALRAKYDKTANVKAIVDGYLIKVNTHSRQDELQADSLGHILLLNAGYLSCGSLMALQKLKKADSSFFKEPLKLKSLFSDSLHSFKEGWLAGTYSNKIYHEDENDSLATHPDCDARILALISKFSISKDLIDTGGFVQGIEFARKKAYYINLEYCLERENYLLSLYFALQLKQLYPEDAYLTMATCKSFYHILCALKEHKFSNYVPQPHPDFDQDINLLIVFLNNLSYSEYKTMLGVFFRKFSDGQPKSEHLQAASLYAEASERPAEEILQRMKELRKAQKFYTFDDLEKQLQHERN